VALQLTYNFAAGFVRVSLLILYLRIFQVSYRANVMIWVGIVVTAIAHMAFLIAYLIILVPSPSHQELWAMPKNHAAPNNIAAVSGVYGIVIDFYILAIPVQLVLGLHLPLGRKVGICAIFLTGLRLVMPWNLPRNLADCILQRLYLLYCWSGVSFQSSTFPRLALGHYACNFTRVPHPAMSLLEHD
jgi:hypothetical protein